MVGPGGASSDERDARGVRHERPSARPCAYAAIDAADRPEVWISLRAVGRCARRRRARRRRRAGRCRPAARRADRRGEEQRRRRRICRPPPRARLRRRRRRRRRHASSPGCVPPAPSCSARPTSTSSPPGWSAPAARTAPCGTPAAPTTSRADRARAPPSPSRSAWSTSRSAPTRPAPGRVPAALQGIVGIKPTLGVVPTDGVVPACRSYDCVTVFARDLDTADAAMGVMAGATRARRARSRPTRRWPRRARPGSRSPRDLARTVRRRGAAAFRAAAVAWLRSDGATRREIDLDAVPRGRPPAVRRRARRRAARGRRRVRRRPPARGRTRPSARSSRAAGAVPATRLLADRRAPGRAHRRPRWPSSTAATRCSCPPPPGTRRSPRSSADPVGVNSRLGHLHQLLQPDGPVRGRGAVGHRRAAPSSACQRRRARRCRRRRPRPGAAGRRTDPSRRTARRCVDPRAHRRRTVAARAGARRHRRCWWSARTCAASRWPGSSRTAGRALGGPGDTAPLYRLARLDTDPPKPGLVRVGPDDGAAIGGELWLVGTAMLGDFLAALPAPMSLGRVDARRRHRGGRVRLRARRVAVPATDITHHGDWPTYLRYSASSASDATRV